IGDFDYARAMAFALDRVRRVRSPGTPAVLLAPAFVAGAGGGYDVEDDREHDREDEGEDAIVVGGAGAIPTSAFDGFDYVARGHTPAAACWGGGAAYSSGAP